MNKNEINSLGRVWVDIEYNCTQTDSQLLITERDEITPLLGVKWLKQLPIIINKFSLDKETSQPETIDTKFMKLFEINHTNENAAVKTSSLPNTAGSTADTITFKG